MKTHCWKNARSRPNFFFLLGVLFLACGFSRSANAAPNATTPARTAKARSEAIAFARQMGIGWNLGDTLEAIADAGKATSVRDYETAWGNPVTTKAMFDGIKASGFRSVRIPVAWSNMMGPDYTISPKLMARVKQVVQYGLDDNLYVILNIHWDGGWISKFPDNPSESMKRYKAMWSQIAGNFKGCSNHLIFESLNEEGNFPQLWNLYGSMPNQRAKAYETLNTINQAFTDLVRASDGSNSRRYLLIAGYNTNIGRTADPLFQMPRDPAARSMVSVHYYTPAPFALLEKDASWGKAVYTWGTPAEVQAVKTDMLPLKARFIDKGIPVVLGEYGCPTNKDPASIVKYISTVCQTAYSLGFVPMLWDAGGFYNRKTLHWNNPQVGEALTRIAHTPRRRADGAARHHQEPSTARSRA